MKTKFNFFKKQEDENVSYVEEKTNLHEILDKLGFNVNTIDIKRTILYLYQSYYHRRVKILTSDGIVDEISIIVTMDNNMYSYSFQFILENGRSVSPGEYDDIIKITKRVISDEDPFGEDS